MVEGKEFRELMLQVVRTRMAFRRSMQRTLKKNNAGITFEMLQILSCLWHEPVSYTHLTLPTNSRV